MSTPAASTISLRLKWAAFIAERFPMTAHGPMVLCFTLGNFAVAAHLTGVAFDAWDFLAAVALTLSFFFRLRCFDEIKDYEVDLQVNPTRPLARGLLSLADVKQMLFALTIFEVVVAMTLGASVLCAHGLAIVYSYLMYKEFFIGRWLRPHLTTYALTHTLVSVLLGVSVMVQADRAHLTLGTLPQSLWVVALMNWFMFNLFEFARKTFAVVEERPHVESYSSLFGIRSATALSLGQIVLALVCAPALARPWLGALSLLPLAVAAYFLAARSLAAARWFRAGVSAYLILFYACLAWLCLA